MPTAARAGGEDKELATAAGNKVVALRIFSADRVVEDGVRVHRAARVRDAFDAERRDNRSVGTDGQAAKSWKTIDCKIKAPAVIAPAWAVGQAQAAHQRLWARNTPASFSANLHPRTL